MKILHLDDHTLFAEGFSAVLSQHDESISVFSATTSEVAFAALDQQPDMDLILIDLNMPDIDGLAFIQNLNQKSLFIPFIVLSASEDLWHIRHALRDGAGGFIPKTYSVEQIVSVIEQVLQGKVVVPEHIAKSIASLPEKEPLQDHHRILSAYKLGQRQLDVLKLMQQGHSNDDIADLLNLSKNTIKTHARTLFTAFQVSNRLECVRYAERIGLI